MCMGFWKAVLTIYDSYSFLPGVPQMWNNSSQIYWMLPGHYLMSHGESWHILTLFYLLCTISKWKTDDNLRFSCVLIRVFTAVIKTINKSNLGRNGLFQFTTGDSPSLRDVRTRTHDRKIHNLLNTLTLGISVPIHHLFICTVCFN